jgi:hypothetical protein
MMTIASVTGGILLIQFFLSLLICCGIPQQYKDVVRDEPSDENGALSVMRPGHGTIDAGDITARDEPPEED